MRGCTCRGPLLCPQCTQLAQRAGVVAPPQVPAISERAFQQAIVRLAKEQGWLVHFATDSRKSPPGYPDLTLVHPTRHVALWAELKVPGGSLTLQQAHWIKALGEVERTAAFVWQPTDWEFIRHLLATEDTSLAQPGQANPIQAEPSEAEPSRAKHSL